MRDEGDEILATAVERYAKELPRPETERHQMKRAIVARVQRKRQEQDPSQKRDGADQKDKGR
ncbi:MAG: hypothetical protein ACOH2K_13450 [Burkholderiaceae bacterium]